MVVLRPEPGASETVRRARERGLDASAMPLFEIEPVAWEPPDPAQFDALLLTSGNAVRYGGEGLARLRGLPVHAVGESTATAARKAGFQVATVRAGGVDELLGSLPAGLQLLHLCGEHRRTPTIQRHIVPIAVYRSIGLPPPDDLKVLQGSVVLVHSPRAGMRLREILDDANFSLASIALAAISPAAAEAAGCGWAEVATAEQPSDEALLALAARLCNKPDPQ